MAKRTPPKTPRKRDAGVAAEELAEELNRTLNEDFPATADYQEAIDAVLAYFESVEAGLKDDARRRERDAEKDE